MRQFVLVTAIAASLVGAAPVFATEPAPATPEATEAAAPAKPVKPAKAAKDPNRLICTREAVVGSNRPEKVCYTAAERERMRDAAGAAMRNDRGTESTGLASGPGL